MQEWEWEQVKEYFRKILNSFAVGLLWMLAVMTAGLYFRLAFVGERMHWYNLLFYGLFFSTFAGLIWYFYKTWRD
jgi:hypothetical protein